MHCTNNYHMRPPGMSFTLDPTASSDNVGLISAAPLGSLGLLGDVALGTYFIKT